MNKITRAEWGARPPKFVPAGINTESGTDHWEGTTLGEFPHESCTTKVQVIQDFHMDSRGWSDIAYNFLVCPHGFVFVGRDHGIRSAANGTNIGNDHSEAACYIGGPGDIFTLAARSAFHELNQEIGGETYPHQYWFNTACPGPDIVQWLKDGQPIPTTVTTEGENMQTPCSIKTPDGKRHVLCRGITKVDDNTKQVVEDRALYINTDSGTGFAGFVNHGGTWIEELSVSLDGDIVGIGTDNAIYRVFYENDHWSEISRIGGEVYHG